MPPTFEQDIQAILAESDPARRRLLAAKTIDAGQYTGMTSNQARQVIDLVAQRDTIPYAQAAAEIRDAYSSMMQQTPVQAGPRTLGRAVQRGALVQQAQLDAAVRGGGVQLPAPYYEGPEAGRQAYEQRFYQTQGANEQGVIPRQRGNLAASLLGVEGGQSWYTDPAGTAVAVAGGLGVEPGASIGYNLMREMGDPQWQTPEQASASVMRNQAAAGPVQFIRGKQAENMAGSILGTLGGYAGAAGAGGKAGARATAALGRGGARTAARVAGAVAGENLGIGLQAGALEAGRTMDAGAGARAGWEATTPGVVALVATKLARGQQVNPLEWADLGLSVGFDGLSVFQAMRAVGLPEQVAKQAAEQTVASKELLALPPGRNAIGPDGSPAPAPPVIDPRAAAPDPNQYRGPSPMSQGEQARYQQEMAGYERQAAQGQQIADRFQREVQVQDPFYSVTPRAQQMAEQVMREIGPARHKERLAVTRLALKQQFPQLGDGSLNRITRETAKRLDAEAMQYGQQGEMRPVQQTPGQQMAQQVVTTPTGPNRQAAPETGRMRSGPEPEVDPRGRVFTPPEPDPVDPWTLRKFAPKPKETFGERLEVPGSTRTAGEANLTRGDIESRLVGRATERGLIRGNEDFARQFTGEAEVDTAFRGNMPRELIEALEGRPELRSMIRTRVPKGTGEDSLSAMGTDRFVEMLAAQQGNKVRQAMDAFDGDPDPEVSWLVAARQPIDLGDRLSEVPASSLVEGSQFRLGTDEFTVVRRDGILTAVDQTGHTRDIADYQGVPISKGSLRQGGEKAAKAAMRRVEQLESEPIPFGDDATPVSRPNLSNRTVRASRADMESAGFEKVAEMGSQQAAVAYAKRQEADGGPRHMVIKEGGKHLVMRGGTLPTLMVALGLGSVAKAISEANSPEEAEAAIQAAGMGDLDLSDPWVWLALGAAGVAGVGGAAKAMGKTAPGVRSAAQVASRAARVPKEAASWWSGPLVDRLAKAGKGKPETTKFVDAARTATDEANAAKRRWSAEIIDPVAKRMHGAGSVLAGRRARAELQHMERVAEVDGVEAFESRGQRLVEGLESEDAFSKPVRQWLQSYRRLYKTTGKHMEDAGLEIEVVGEDGKPAVVPFVQQGEPKWVRNVSPDLVRALVEGGDYGQEVVNAVAKAVTSLNKSKDAAGEWKRIANAIKSSYDGSDVSTAKVIRTVNAEHLRTIERMPAAITFRFGSESRTIQLLDVDPIRQLEQMASKAALRSAVAKHIGYERSTHYGREKSISDMRQGVASETGGIGGDLFDETLRSLSGLPLAQHLRHMATPGTSTYDLQRGVRSVFTLARQAQLSSSFVVNMPEPFALPRVMTGNKNFAKALLSLATRPRRTVEELRREGGLTRDNAPWYGFSRPLTPGDGVGNFLSVWETTARFLGRAIGTGHRLSNEWGELVSAASGRAFIDDLRAGKTNAYHRVRLRMMNFNDAQVELLASGKASDELYQAVQTRAAQRMVGSNSMPHEVSKASNSNLYRSVIWHDSYTQMISNRTAKMVSMIFDPSLPKPERAAAAVMAADLGISGSMVGMTGIMLRAMVFGGLAGLAYEWNRSKQQLSGEEGAEGVGRLMLHTFEAYFGGPLYAAMGSAFDDGLTSSDVTRMSGAAVASMEMWNFLTGAGRYAHLPLSEQTDLYLRTTTPLYRGTRDWIAAHALGDSNPEYNKAKSEVYRYLRENDLISQGEFGQAEAFTVGMRRARRFIMAGDYEKAREAMIDAAQSDGRNWDQVRQSLLGMRVLPRIPLQDRAKHLQAIRARLGEDGYARVLMHDRLLEAMAR